jgi:transcriptional regulator with XRE-family HTH domain
LDYAKVDFIMRRAPGQARRMKKSIHTDEYAAVLALLKKAREAAGLTQVQLAEKLGQSQSFVSKAEVGERRLDIIQLRTICKTLGTTLSDFVAKLEERLAQGESQE